LFINRLKATVADGNLQSAIVCIYKHMGDLLVEGRFDNCNSLLERVDPNSCDKDLLLSFLMATATAGKVLPARKLLYEGTRNRFLRELGKNETKELLDNLV